MGCDAMARWRTTSRRTHNTCKAIDVRSQRGQELVAFCKDGFVVVRELAPADDRNGGKTGMLNTPNQDSSASETRGGSAVGERAVSEVAQFISKLGIEAVDQLAVGEITVRAKRNLIHKEVAHGVGTVTLNENKRINDVADGLRHLLAIVHPPAVRK
eukprot:scaffold130997_cov28-Tisochrysis_lutea.AAC.1